nr:MAG TPA: protein of unknown function DUF1803 [Caudoviricetes sp.]
MTAEELYSKLIEIKKSKPDYQFSELDLLPYGNVENQMEQLINEGKIIRNRDVLETFNVVN